MGFPVHWDFSFKFLVVTVKSVSTGVKIEQLTGFDES